MPVCGVVINSLRYIARNIQRIPGSCKRRCVAQVQHAQFIRCHARMYCCCQCIDAKHGPSFSYQLPAQYPFAFPLINQFYTEVRLAGVVISVAFVINNHCLVIKAISFSILLQRCRFGRPQCPALSLLQSQAFLETFFLAPVRFSPSIRPSLLAVVARGINTCCCLTRW